MYRFSRFSRFASQIARSIAHPSAFLVVLVMVCVWLLTGPVVGFSSLWQTVFNSSTTAITFLLLFLIQHTQARETAAMQLKLNELIRASEGSHNALLDIEHLTDRDYDLIRENYSLLAQQAREQLKDGNVKWATARIQMESLDSLLDPLDAEAAPDTALPDSLEEQSGDEQAEAPRNASLDRLALAAANALNAPMALIARFESDVQALPGQAGLPEPFLSQRSAPLSFAFSDHVIAVGTTVVITDTCDHSLAANSPSVTEWGIAAFAGVPLANSDSVIVGSFCVMDITPRTWTDAELALLQAFADLAAREMHHAAPDVRSRSTTAPLAAPPVVSQGNADTVSSGAIQQSASGQILVVDDSATNRKLLSHYLKTDGYTATVFASGEEALAYLQTHDTDLILLDIMMAGMDGEQVLQSIRSNEALRPIPVVMISALDEQESVNRCLHQGAQDYLLKPFTPQALHACIRKHLAAD